MRLAVLKLISLGHLEHSWCLYSHGLCLVPRHFHPSGEAPGPRAVSPITFPHPWQPPWNDLVVIKRHLLFCCEPAVVFRVIGVWVALT